jgi:hypothetical protein
VVRRHQHKTDPRPEGGGISPSGGRYSTPHFDIPSTVDVATMQRPALIASPLPHLKRTRPFRAACGNALTNRARLITLPLGNDAHHTACRYRLARQHVAEHRPAGVVHAFRHLCLLPASSGSHLRRRSPRNAARDRATSRGGNADIESDASQDPARHRFSLSRRCFVVAGLFRPSAGGAALAINKQCVEQQRQRASSSP